MADTAWPYCLHLAGDAELGISAADYLLIRNLPSRSTLLWHRRHLCPGLSHCCIGGGGYERSQYWDELCGAPNCRLTQPSAVAVVAES